MTDTQMRENLSPQMHENYSAMMRELGEQASQRVGHGECDGVSRSVYNNLRRRHEASAGVGAVRETVSNEWTPQHDAALDQGHPAFVRATGTTTPQSEWHSGTQGHAVVLVGRNPSGQYVGHDPDTTHAPGGDRTSLGRNLRTFSSSEVHSFSPVYEGGETSGMHGSSPDAPLDVFTQHRPRGPSLMSRALGFLGFGRS
ncbi:hypothetical protein [Polaromonas sp.]|uniref:hypothetical protein n=1 Tax=Polaromonas sp. TaxID=1869339 RepID=UPI00326312E2